MEKVAENKCSSICGTCKKFLKFTFEELKKHKYAEDGICQEENIPKSFWQKCN